MNSYDLFAIDGLIARLAKKGIQLDRIPTAIYARKSTKDETQISLESQIEYCKKYIAEDKRLNLVKTYSEDKVSGYHIEGRKQLNALLEDARKGNIRIIVYYALDRESRNIADAIKIDKELGELDVLQLYASQAFSNDANGRFVKSIIRADAQRQVEVVSERVLLAMEKTAKSAKSTGGRCLYGYKVVNSKYEIDDKEKDAVKLAFDLACAGSTIPDISVKLARKGYFSKKNAPFPVNTLWGMLRNEKYTGTYIYFKKDGRRREGRVSQTDMDEIRIEGGIPQIIPEATFKRVQSILDAKTNKSSPRVVEDYLLRGYIFCGESGKAMHGEISYGGDSRNKYTRYTTPRRETVKRSISKGIIESATAEVIASILNQISSKYLDKTKIAPSLKGYLNSELIRLQSKLPGLRRELMSSVNSLAKLENNDTIAFVNKEINARQEVLNSMESRVTSLQAQLSHSNSVIKAFLSIGITITGDDVLKDPVLFKKSLSLYIKEINVFEDKVVYNLKDLT